MRVAADGIVREHSVPLPGDGCRLGQSEILECRSLTLSKVESVAIVNQRALLRDHRHWNSITQQCVR